MKNKLKNNLKFGVLIFGISIMLVNCQKEEAIGQEQAQEVVSKRPFSITTIESPEIQSNTNLVKKLSNLNKKLDSQNITGKGKDKYSTPYGFTVNTDYSKYIESADGSYHSYTFLVNRKENNGLIENLLATLQPDGNYKMILVAYDVTAEERKTLGHGITEGLSKKMTAYKIEDTELLNGLFSKIEPAIECFVTVAEWCICGGHPDEDGFSSCPDSCYNSQVIGVYCTGGGSGGEYDPGSNPFLGSGSTGNTGSGTSGGGSGNGTTTSTVVVPITTPMQAWEFIERCMGGFGLSGEDGLSAEELAYLQDPNTDALAISSFLSTNRCSIEAKAFVKSAIEILREDENIDLKSLEEFINGMDNKCHALVLLKSIFNVNSDFTNLMKNTYFKKGTDKHINIHDISVGEGEPPLLSTEGARTQPYRGTHPDNNEDVVIVEFNNTYLDTATDLGYVNTLYHELLHVHILHLYHDVELLNTYPSYTSLNNALNNYFSDDKNATFVEAQIQEMHNIYVDFIDVLAESLLQYSIENNINGVNLEYAKKLVWGGLKGNNVFTTNLTTNQQNEATSLLAKENFNHADSKSSKPCN